jgi:hypothetical protein
MIHLAILIIFLPPSGMAMGWTCEAPQPEAQVRAWVTAHPYVGYRVMRDDDPDYAQTLPACLEMLRVEQSIQDELAKLNARS